LAAVVVPRGELSPNKSSPADSSRVAHCNCQRAPLLGMSCPRTCCKESTYEWQSVMHGRPDLLGCGTQAARNFLGVLCSGRRANLPIWLNWRRLMMSRGSGRDSRFRTCSFQMWKSLTWYMVIPSIFLIALW